MTGDQIIAIVAILAKMVSCTAAIYFAYKLASDNKEGWGWLIFLAIILGSTTIKYID